MSEEAIADAITERLAALRASAADRKAHATYLERLLAAPDESIHDQFYFVQVPGGVSDQIAWALVTDVEWLRLALARKADAINTPYPNAYRDRRVAGARAARRRSQTAAKTADRLGLP